MSHWRYTFVCRPCSAGWWTDDVLDSLCPRCGEQGEQRDSTRVTPL